MFLNYGFLQSWVFSLQATEKTEFSGLGDQALIGTKTAGWVYALVPNSLWNLSSLTQQSVFLTHIYPMQVGKGLRNYLERALHYGLGSGSMENHTTAFKSITFAYSQMARTSLVSHLIASVPGNVG